MASDPVHHLYSSGSAQDLIPYCGAITGPDREVEEWNTEKALGGWTPRIMDGDR